MEQMKQCPNCGKYVSADKTYCMSCGTTLGVRCPSCRRVLPVGSRSCPGCGHSFVKKDKKPRRVTAWPYIKRHVRPIITLSLLLVTVAVVILSALPALRFELTDISGRAPVVTAFSASGYSLVGYFLGAHPADITGLLELSAFSDLNTPLRLCLYAEGLGWLVLLVGLALSVTLLLANYQHMGHHTSRRLSVLLAVTLGGGVVLLGMDTVIRILLSNAATAAWLTVPEGASEALPYAVELGSVFPILVAALSLTLFTWHLVLHLTVLQTAHAEDERPLGTILKAPFAALSTLVRRRRHKKNGRSTDGEAEEKTVTCTGRFSVYLILLAVSLVFTQALLSKISNIFFWFMLLLPLCMLLYALLARNALSVSMLSDSATTEKNSPYTYQFRIDNHLPLAFPFIDADVSIPQANSVRCTRRSIRLSLAPLSGYHMKNTVRFRFRGTYDIGVQCFYVYDLFRMFRVRVPVESMVTVYVLPRRLTMEETLAQAISDSTVRTVHSPLAVDRLEVSDIRDYQNGDPLKSIHWKLSSKSETFIVKDYNTGTSNQTVIFCDLAAHFSDASPKAQVTEDFDARPNVQTEGKAKKKKQKRAPTPRKRPAAETADTHAISDEALRARLDQRAAAAEHLGGKEAVAPAAKESIPEAPTLRDVRELANESLYEDMNEYLADGVVELTIASVLSELRQGHEVLLIWFDRRSDSGVYAYPLRGADEFEHIYHLFATAPLCAPEQRVTGLTAMVSDTQSAKQLFVISDLDKDMLSALSDLPGVSDAASIGAAEVILYNPEHRFRYPKERAAYLDGCREQLIAHGLSLTTSGAYVARSEGGERHEA